MDLLEKQIAGLNTVRAELVADRDGMIERVAVIEEKIDTLDRAIAILAPDAKPTPPAAAAKQRRVRTPSKPAAAARPSQTKASRVERAAAGERLIDRAVKVLRRHAMKPMEAAAIAREMGYDNVESLKVTLAHWARKGVYVSRTPAASGAPRGGALPTYGLLPAMRSGPPTEKSPTKPAPAQSSPSRPNPTPPKPPTEEEPPRPREERPTTAQHETVTSGHRVRPKGLDFQCDRCKQVKSSVQAFTPRSCDGRAVA